VQQQYPTCYTGLQQLRASGDRFVSIRKLEQHFAVDRRMSMK
jgi:hypothetical protein